MLSHHGVFNHHMMIISTTIINININISGELLKIRATIPIILCTGHSETISSEQAREVGIKAFLMKPLANQELAQAIRRVLDAKAEG